MGKTLGARLSENTTPIVPRSLAADVNQFSLARRNSTWNGRK